MLDLRGCRVFCGETVSVDSAGPGLPAAVHVLLRRQAAAQKRAARLETNGTPARLNPYVRRDGAECRCPAMPPAASTQRAPNGAFLWDANAASTESIGKTSVRCSRTCQRACASSSRTIFRKRIVQHTVLRRVRRVLAVRIAMLLAPAGPKQPRQLLDVLHLLA